MHVPSIMYKQFFWWDPDQLLSVCRLGVTKVLINLEDKVIDMVPFVLDL